LTFLFTCDKLCGEENSTLFNNLNFLTLLLYIQPVLEAQHAK
jgi:hypothetical protein